MQVPGGAHQRGVAVGDPHVARARGRTVRVGVLRVIGEREPPRGTGVLADVEDGVRLDALDVHPQRLDLLDPRRLGCAVGDEVQGVGQVDLVWLADEVVDHVVEQPHLLGRVAPAEAGWRVEVRLLLTGRERRPQVDHPHRVMQVDLADRRALARLGVHEAGAEADDPAVDRRALLLHVDVDDVLPRLDLQRAELVLEHLGAGRGRGVAHLDAVSDGANADARASASARPADVDADAGADARAATASMGISSWDRRTDDMGSPRDGWLHGPRVDRAATP